MYWVSTGNMATNERNIFLVNFAEFSKPVTIVAANSEATSYMFTAPTLGNLPMVEPGVS